MAKALKAYIACSLSPLTPCTVPPTSNLASSRIASVTISTYLKCLFIAYLTASTNQHRIILSVPLWTHVLNAQMTGTKMDRFAMAGHIKDRLGVVDLHDSDCA